MTSLRGEQKTPRVSIVVIFLNQEPFLAETIDGVLAQSYDSWELLLVNDGSSDASEVIARRYASQDSRIRYLSHPGGSNRGASASRSLGIEHAAGEFVSLLDGDDVWTPETLADQVAWLDRHPDAALAYGSVRAWYSWTPSGAGKDRTIDVGVQAGSVFAPGEFLRLMIARRAQSPWPSAMIFRRLVAEDVGRFEADFPLLYEDQIFVTKINAVAPVVFTGQTWVNYRQRPDSMYASGVDQLTRRRARERYLLWASRYLAGVRPADIELHALVRSELAAVRRKIQSQSQTGFLRSAKSAAKAAVRRATPTWLWQAGRRLLRGTAPPVGGIRFGDLRRLTPLSRKWGKDRGGQPIDRVYIESFLAQHEADVRGRVLEAGDSRYTRQFGGGAVTRSDVFHAIPGNPDATFVTDLATDQVLPSSAYDCVILTQVLHLLPDPVAAVRTLKRILKPDGVLLITTAGISQISRWDDDRWGDYWRFTRRSLRYVVEQEFDGAVVTVESHGNVLVAAAMLYGIGAAELTSNELLHKDDDYQVLLTARVVNS
jgi:glycosyltransferase involved in cell wall biosynthesis/SAM-dependent methyltransferase